MAECNDCQGIGTVTDDDGQSFECWLCGGTGETCNVCGEGIEACICEVEDSGS